MPGPTLTYAFILSTLYGAGFHLIFGGGALRLVVFLFAGWLGFALGHIGGMVMRVQIFQMGAIQFLTASIGAILALFIGHLLTKNAPSASRSTRSR